MGRISTVDIPSSAPRRTVLRALTPNVCRPRAIETAASPTRQSGATAPFTRRASDGTDEASQSPRKLIVSARRSIVTAHRTRKDDLRPLHTRCLCRWTIRRLPLPVASTAGRRGGRMQRVHAHGRRARRGVCGRGDRTPKRCAFGESGEALLALGVCEQSIIPRRHSGHFLRRPGALARDAPPHSAPMRMHSLHAPPRDAPPHSAPMRMHSLHAPPRDALGAHALRTSPGALEAARRALGSRFVESRDRLRRLSALRVQSRAKL
jgi:hypothetical protein